jgi:SAM-dependent methyltransferase
MLYDGTLTQAKLRDDFFDIVVIRNVLEHLFDPNIDLQEIRRILKPNGYVYVKVPNGLYEHGFRCRLIFGRQHNFDPPYHLNHFHPTSLKTVLAKAKLQFVSWSVEQPTIYSQRIKNLARQTGYRVAQASFILTGRRLPFPQIVLSCIARKIM